MQWVEGAIHSQILCNNLAFALPQKHAIDVNLYGGV